MIACDVSPVAMFKCSFHYQVLWICLDGLEEGDIRRGPLVPHPSQQVKVWRNILWNASHPPQQVKFWRNVIWNASSGVAVWFLCGTKSGANPPRTRKQRKTPYPFYLPWPGAVISSVITQTPQIQMLLVWLFLVGHSDCYLLRSPICLSTSCQPTNWVLFI